ncbi:MAG TPA: HlyD family secretion protein [Steroidobacteraceae bacterium]|nr:HlyD family secretion protein [Steroidobacteraceae bacterium]
MKLAAVAVDPRPSEESVAEPRLGRKRIVLIGAALTVAAAAAWLMHWWLVGRYIESTDDAYLRADSVTVAPKISGYVAEVYVSDNETVGASQPLARLDSRRYGAALDKSAADVAARKADLARTEADLLQQRAAVVQSRAQLLGARTSEDYAAQEVKRYEPLVASGAETEEHLADLRNNQRQAAARLAIDTAALEAAERQLGSTTAQIQQARAQLEAAEANVQQADLDVQDTTVHSPLAGRVGDLTVRVGQYVQPGTRLMTIVPVQSVYLEANFKETQIGRMRAGQPASIHIDALPDTALRGTVLSFAPATGSQFALLPAQNATGNFTKIVQRVPVRIRIDAADAVGARLLPGLSVRVSVDTRSAHPRAHD